MATMDDILGVPPGGETAPNGTLQWTMQQGGSSTQAGTETSPVASVPPFSTAPAEEARPKEEIPDGGLKPGAVSDGERVYSHEEMYKMLNPYKPPTDEELEKQRKKEKRDKLFSAIGDGVMALSNLFFTTRGAPNMYTGRNTMSEKTKERYEKITKEREEKRNAYIVGIQKAREADQRREQAEREWQRVLGLDARNEERYREEAEHKRNREKIDDDRYAATLEYKKQRDAADDEKWQKTYEEGRRRANQSHALAVQTHKDNKELRRQQIAATGAKAVRGKQLGFSDGNGNQVSIYENVWKGSMQQVYDALAEDMKAAHKADSKNNPRVPRHKTASEKADFVKQNWHKSPRAAAIMLSLSKLDPATMHSGLIDGDDVEDYIPSSSEDDVIDYVPSKK